MEKELLYVGTYTDTDGNRILKIGTTNDLKRRQREHNRTYKRATAHTMPTESSFEYIWTLPLSKYNTLRYEDSNKEKWIAENIGEYVRNDRFVISEELTEVEIKIRKTYKIALKQCDFFVQFYHLTTSLPLTNANGRSLEKYTTCTIFSPNLCALLPIDKLP